jgi:hypothetical protein
MSIARVLAAATGNKLGVDLLTFFGISLGIIPSVVGRCDCVGQIVADLPSLSDRPRGVPVFCCSHSTWRPVVATHEREAGVLVAPTVTRTALGAFGSLPVVQARLLRVVHRHEPDRRNDEIYRPLFDLLQSSHHTHGSVPRELAGLRHPGHILSCLQR